MLSFAVGLEVLTCDGSIASFGVIRIFKTLLLC